MNAWIYGQGFAREILLIERQFGIYANNPLYQGVAPDQGSNLGPTD